ncbi:hypothetical protein GEMRC1_004629 [Eukaryota sp. GEM-RC1]
MRNFFVSEITNPFFLLRGFHMEGEAQMDNTTAIRQCIKAARVLDGLLAGLRVCVKALDTQQAIMCCLASDADHAEYVTLIEALCKENNIHIFRDCSREELGEFCGLYKLDVEGNPRNIVKTSVCVINRLPEGCEPFRFLTEQQ